jgi:hypothetical protein
MPFGSPVAPLLGSPVATEEESYNSAAALTLAKHDLKLYLDAPLLSKSNHPLMPTEDIPHAYSPQQAWTRGDCVPVGVQLKARHDGCAKRHSYLAASAIAYHGGVAASARPERTFRDVGFINNVLRQRMKPEMISRAARLRRNRDLRIPIPEIVRRYNAKHPNSKRRGAKRTTADADSNEVVDVTD